MTWTGRAAHARLAGALLAALATTVPAAAQSPDSLREDFRRSLLASTHATAPAERAERLAAARRQAAAYFGATADSLRRTVGRD